MGLPSLLSSIASLKSTVYVTSLCRESNKVILIFFPAARTLATSNCGGEMTTFSLALANFTYSLKNMSIFFDFTFTALSAGLAPITSGGSSSYLPPSGVPILAQDTMVSIVVSSSRKSMVNLRIALSCSIKCQHLLYMHPVIRQTGHLVLSTQLALGSKPIMEQPSTGYYKFK